MSFNNTQWSVRVGVVVLSGGLSQLHSARPPGWCHCRVCRTCSACVTVPPVSCNFSRIGGLWQWLGQCFGHLAKRRFQAFIAFGHPSL